MADEPSKLPFDPTALEVSRLWFLVGWSPYPVFIPEQVHRWSSPDAKTRDLLPLFLELDLAETHANELQRRGIVVNAHSLGTADELTDLLSKLKDLGVTHVVFDPP